MSLWPFLRQTLVSSHSKNEVLRRIALKTRLIDSEVVVNRPVFNGAVSPEGFRISLVIRSAQNALPLTIGRVENTSRGSLIFLRLCLFPGARLYLWFSTTLCVLIAAVFLTLSSLTLAVITALLIALANYLVLTLSFHQKAHETIHQIQGILAEEGE
ncbi:hypothetical protein [Marinoscillum sp. 108]|uniref:hypothetical protein n=1 Tax=Marinoscillum sp. 108 TaxID=2653151 RepID=UPI0012F04A20|nr:hypothetical protein [Marinoscillum sp. 108]VXD18262.1 conserved hypothetical protein [Marinoscillum sp. 108]